MQRDELVRYLDGYLRTHEMKDFSQNGVQVEGSDEVERLAFAVDANLATITGAAEAGAQMLIVHHGLFWGQPIMVTGPHRRRLKTLLDAGCSLYACHLPLDRHPEVGNNVQLAHLLGLRIAGEFGEEMGLPIGVIAEAPPQTTRDHLVARLTDAIGAPALVLPAGPADVRRVGIISGGAAREAAEAAAQGCDTYLTGETHHGAYHDAEELGINVIYGGHYATETVGLKALAAHLGQKFGLPSIFIDRPTGL